MSRLGEWWEDLDELERATWVMTLAFAFAALAGVVLRGVETLR